MGDDISNEISPSRLEEICIDFVARNLTGTLCKDGPAGGLIFREGINLPPALTDLILKSILSTLKLDTLQKDPKNQDLVKSLNLFSDAEKCKLRHIVLKRAPISDDVVQALCDLCKAHGVLEIDMSNSSDMNGDDNDFTPPYNHAVLLPSFIMKLSGQTIQRLIMNHTLLAYSLNQIMMFTGWRAKYRPKYLQSTAQLGNIPMCLSTRLCPQLNTLDVSEAFNAWFLTIDPNHPPPLKVLNINGYHDIRLNSMMKKLLKQFVEGEDPEDERLNKHRPTVAHSTSERKLQHYPFFQLIPPEQETLNEFLRSSELEKRLRQLDASSGDSSDQPKNNFVFRQLNILSIKSTLQQLSLFNTWLSESDMKDIVFNLKELQHLDVGWPAKNLRSSSRFRPESVTVWDILDSLPQLKYLDVSGTNYGEELDVEMDARVEERKGRLPLQFLGLWGTRSCRMPQIGRVAHQVSGDKDEAQMLTCLELYMDRSEIVTDILNRFSTNQQEAGCEVPNRALKVFLRCAQRYSTSGNLLFMCAANIYYLVQFQLARFTVYQKREIINTMILLLEKNPTSQMLVRNCMVTFFHFNLPADVMFDFDHVSKCILDIFDKQRDVHEVGFIAGNLCNALVCSMQIDLKWRIKSLPYVEIMIDIIKGRLRSNNSDDVMDTAWSGLWNVTDETPINSHDFVDQGGLDLFTQCFDKFSDGSHPDLIRNMMGLMGNLSEVPAIRPLLIEKGLLEVVTKLIRSTESGIEVSYNACSTLSNLLVDESDILKGVDRHHIRQEMKEAILNWDEDASRNINYRTFRPLLEILRCPTEPVPHLWVVWAMHNLCRRETKYVDLLIEDGGVGIVKAIHQATKDEKTREFTQSVIEKCDRVLDTPV